MIQTLVSLGFSAFLLQAQPAAQDSLLRWMNQIAQQQLTQWDSAIGGVRTRPDTKRRKQRVRWI